MRTMELASSLDRPSATSRAVSTAHKQMWFLEKLGDAGKAYRSHSKIHLIGRLDVAALERAIRRLFRRHEVLRTAIEERDGALERRVLDVVNADLAMIDVSHAAPADREQALAERMKPALAHRFDMARPPLIRWVLFRVTPDYHVLLQSDHHNVHDGRSFQLLVTDLGELYAAECVGREARLPRVKAQYSAFCEQEAAWLQGPESAQALRMLMERLSSLRGELGLFSGRRRATHHGYVGGQLLVPVGEQECRLIKQAAVSLGVSRYVFLLSAYCILCAKYESARRFCIGTSLANRPSKDFEFTVGMF